jgi:hypothetical protein
LTLPNVVIAARCTSANAPNVATWRKEAPVRVLTCAEISTTCRMTAVMRTRNGRWES